MHAFVLPGETEEPLTARGIGARIAVAASGILILVLGLFPGLLIDRVYVFL
ncbi:MAG: hypothetical protein R3F30_05135 [Planctomycetota bacterium]